MSTNVEFNSVLIKKPNSNQFDLSHDHKLSFKMGKLVPFYCQEVLPGDYFNIQHQALLRFSPLISPVMHKVDAYMHYFFVPNRILWDGWEDFITGNRPADQTPAAPYITPSNYGIQINASSLGNYLGLPANRMPNSDDFGKIDKVSALPFAAYQRIWWEYYRDQNMMPDDPNVPDFAYNKIELDNGAQSSNKTLMLTLSKYRCWEHDYFTSALPFAQKGEAVTIPISFDDLELPVQLKEGLQGELGQWKKAATGNPVVAGYDHLLMNNGNTQFAGTGDYMTYDPLGTLVAKGTQEVQTTSLITDLRTAYALQRWLEKNARGGTRYVESILIHFGVQVPDSRLQRPEYIGGSKQPVVISEVLQTAPATSEEPTPQGNMAGHGISVGQSNKVNYKCLEHGYIIGIMSVLPRTGYFQGIPKHFSKFDRLDYYWQEFANIGEQEILNKELYNDVDDGMNEEIFGYIPRYSEYKNNLNRVSGDFANTLNYWHMARDFENRPNLNAQFVQSDPTQRIFAVETGLDDIYCHIAFDIQARRPLPIYSTPL